MRPQYLRLVGCGVITKDIDDFGYIKTTKIIQYMEAARFSADLEQKHTYRRDVESIVVENLEPVDVGGLFRLATWEKVAEKVAVPLQEQQETQEPCETQTAAARSRTSSKITTCDTNAGSSDAGDDAGGKTHAAGGLLAGSGVRRQHVRDQRRLEFEIWRQPGKGSLVCRGEWLVGNPVNVVASPAARCGHERQLWPILPQSSL